MQVILVIFILGWVASLPAVFWWILLALIILALCFGAYFLLDLSNRANFPWIDRVAVDSDYLRGLEVARKKAEAEALSLRTEIEQLRSSPAVEQPDPSRSLYHKVGLSPGAPDWLVEAARRAYRGKLHPDRHPERLKEEAERRFKLAECVFDEIAASRS